MRVLLFLATALTYVIASKPKHNNPICKTQGIHWKPKKGDPDFNKAPFIWVEYCGDISWKKADAWCKSKFGTHLASIHCTNGQSWAKKLCHHEESEEKDHNNHCWIGMHDKTGKGQWGWSDGTKIDYHAWTGGALKPNDKKHAKDCASMSSDAAHKHDFRSWDSHSCSIGITTFLCKNPNAPDPCTTPRPTTRTPTARPTCRPSVRPTGRPTIRTPRPTARPSWRPTARPSWRPSRRPTARPSCRPTVRPTVRRTPKPTPVRIGTPKPSANPSTTTTTKQPTGNPSTTKQPTGNPSTTKQPTGNPSNKPTGNPTKNPTDTPTQKPTGNPTKNPTGNPTEKPTGNPTNQPTMNPVTTSTRATTTTTTTLKPTVNPTDKPSTSPTMSPTDSPSISPTKQPTDAPTKFPTMPPSKNPSKFPSQTPTNIPTYHPSVTPTMAPTPCRDNTTWRDSEGRSCSVLYAQMVCNNVTRVQGPNALPGDGIRPEKACCGCQIIPTTMTPQSGSVNGCPANWQDWTPTIHGVMMNKTCTQYVTFGYCQNGYLLDFYMSFAKQWADGKGRTCMTCCTDCKSPLATTTAPQINNAGGVGGAAAAASGGSGTASAPAAAGSTTVAAIQLEFSGTGMTVAQASSICTGTVASVLNVPNSAVLPVQVIDNTGAAGATRDFICTTTVDKHMYPNQVDQDRFVATFNDPQVKPTVQQHANVVASRTGHTVTITKTSGVASKDAGTITSHPAENNANKGPTLMTILIMVGIGLVVLLVVGCWVGYGVKKCADKRAQSMSTTGYEKGMQQPLINGSGSGVHDENL